MGAAESEEDSKLSQRADAPVSHADKRVLTGAAQLIVVRLVVAHASGAEISTAKSRCHTRSVPRPSEPSRVASRSAVGLTTDGELTMARTTHRSKTGSKLYAKRSKAGRFSDVQTYERAHGQDVKRKSAAERATKKKATKRKATKKRSAKKK